MQDVTFLSDRFDRAVLYATHVHGGQARKGTSTPYVAHLLAVAATVLEYDGTEDMAIAALLHDAVEDQGGQGRLADIRNRFGDRVADIVHACSDSTSSNKEKDPWRERKIRYIEHLDTLDGDTLLVSLSDKVHNARSILRDFRKPNVKAEVFGRFKGSKDDTLWYYEQLAEKFVDKFKEDQLVGQLAKELREIVLVLKSESKG